MVLDKTSKSLPKFNAICRSLLIKFNSPYEEHEPTVYIRKCITALTNHLVNELSGRVLVGPRILNTDSLALVCLSISTELFRSMFIVWPYCYLALWTNTFVSSVECFDTQFHNIYTVGSSVAYLIISWNVPAVRCGIMSIYRSVQIGRLLRELKLGELGEEEECGFWQKCETVSVYEKLNNLFYMYIHIYWGVWQLCG